MDGRSDHYDYRGRLLDDPDEEEVSYYKRQDPIQAIRSIVEDEGFGEFLPALDALQAENARLAGELAALRLENKSLAKLVDKSHKAENKARAELHQVQATDALWFLDPNSRESLQLHLRRAGETIDWYDQEFARLEVELQRVKAAAREAAGHLYRHLQLDDNDEVDIAIDLLEQAVGSGGRDE